MKPIRLHLVHGWSYNLDRWQPTFDLLKLKNIEIVIHKVPGLTDPSDEEWDMPKYVAWLDDELKSEDGSVVLLGHSNGGRIALNYDVKHPGKISNLILLDSAGVWVDVGKVSRKRKTINFLAKSFSFLKYIPGVSKFIYRALGATDYYEAPENMKKTLRNMLESDYELDVSRVSAQTTIIWGDQDTMTPISQAKVLERDLPNVNGQIRIIKGARHAAYDTHPVELTKILLAELRRIQAKAQNGS